MGLLRDRFTDRPPEGDLTPSEARSLWPDLFLWVHPNLGWFNASGSDLSDSIRRVVAAAGVRSCLMISEDIPPSWEVTVPRVIETLRRAGGEP